MRQSKYNFNRICMGETLLLSDVQKNEIIVGDDRRIYFINRKLYSFQFLEGIFLLVLCGIPLAVQTFFSRNFFFLLAFLLLVVLVCYKLILPHRKRLRLPYKEVNLAYRSDSRSLFFIDKQGTESLVCALSEVKTQVTCSRGVRYASSHYVLSLVTDKKSIPVGDEIQAEGLRKVQRELEKFSFVADKSEHKVIS